MNKDLFKSPDETSDDILKMRKKQISDSIDNFEDIQPKEPKEFIDRDEVLKDTSDLDEVSSIQQENIIVDEVEDLVIDFNESNDSSINEQSISENTEVDNIVDQKTVIDDVNANKTLEINNIKDQIFPKKVSLTSNDEIKDDPTQNSHFVLKQNPNKKDSEKKENQTSEPIEIVNLDDNVVEETSSGSEDVTEAQSLVESTNANIEAENIDESEEEVDFSSLMLADLDKELEEKEKVKNSEKGLESNVSEVKEDSPIKADKPEIGEVQIEKTEPKVEVKQNEQEDKSNKSREFYKEAKQKTPSLVSVDKSEDKSNVKNEKVEKKVSQKSKEVKSKEKKEFKLPSFANIFKKDGDKPFKLDKKMIILGGSVLGIIILLIVGLLLANNSGLFNSLKSLVIETDPTPTVTTTPIPTITPEPTITSEPSTPTPTPPAEIVREIKIKPVDVVKSIKYYATGIIKQIDGENFTIEAIITNEEEVGSVILTGVNGIVKLNEEVLDNNEDSTINEELDNIEDENDSTVDTEDNIDIVEKTDDEDVKIVDTTENTDVTNLEPTEKATVKPTELIYTVEASLIEGKDDLIVGAPVKFEYFEKVTGVEPNLKREYIVIYITVEKEDPTLEEFFNENMKEDSGNDEIVETDPVDLFKDNFGDSFAKELELIRQQDEKDAKKAEKEEGAVTDDSLPETITYNMEVKAKGPLWFRFAWKPNDVTKEVAKIDEVLIEIMNQNGSLINKENISKYGRYWLNGNVINFAIRNGGAGTWKFMATKSRYVKLGEIGANVMPLTGFITLEKAAVQSIDGSLLALWKATGVKDDNLIVEIVAQRGNNEILLYSANSLDDNIHLLDKAQISTAKVPKGTYNIIVRVQDIDLGTSSNGEKVIVSKTIRDEKVIENIEIR